jgi:tRNA pseudouridine55 synthase
MGTMGSREGRRMLNGVLVVDKPAGLTSHDVVDGVRRRLRQRRAGHTGTLDPFATGVLPVCLGKATRLARFLSEGEKAYHASVRLGVATTTDDLTGEPIGEPRRVELGIAEIERACARFVGEIRQLPPAYSAKRVGGQRLYELARRGMTVEREASRVTVHALEVLSVAGERVELAVRCSAGTYVRALSRDLGDSLEVGGHLVALRRVRSGSFDLEQAVPWDELASTRPERVVPMSRLLPDLPEVRVGSEGASALRHGRGLFREAVISGFPDTPAPRMRVLDE